jgi:pimeloyl-ACP methyl ester carboxylesterase
VRRLFLADSAGINFDIPFESTLFYPETVDQAQQLLALLTPLGYRIPRFVARDIVRHVSTRAGIAQRCMQSMMAGEDLLDGRLAAIRVPVLILWGKQDAIIPVHCGVEMHRQIPQSRLAIFDGFGHLAPIECSGRMWPEIVHFLQAEPALPGSVHEFPH